jgi:alkaline phosphatase D
VVLLLGLAGTSACIEGNLSSDEQASSVDPIIVAPVLTHGTLVGAVTPDRAAIWFRVKPAARVQIECGTKEDLADAWLCSPSSATTDRDHDYTGMLQVEELVADTTYYYRLLIDGRAQQQQRYARFKTFPAEPPSEVTIGLLADSFTEWPAPQLGKLSADDPDFVVVLGDYPHANAMTLSSMRLMRKRLRSNSAALGVDFSQIASGFPLVYVWDDHDFCDSDSGASCPVKETAVQVYNEYWPAYRPGTVDTGIWQRLSYGNLVEVFILDLRTNRTDKTILGSVQRDWLVSALRGSTAQWKVIISTVSFNKTTRKKEHETWSSYDDERTWLVNALDEIDPEHVVFVSGDIHSGGALDDGTYADFPEISVPSTNTAILTCTPCRTLAQCERGERACGLWSQMFDPTGAGYGLIKAARDRLEMVVKGRDGELKGLLTIPE